METTNKITHLILNSPYEVPKAHWLYQSETKRKGRLAFREKRKSRFRGGLRKYYKAATMTICNYSLN